MGLSGVSGPFRGAYNTFTFSTGSVGINAGASGASNVVLWSYTLPTGMDIVVVDAQIFAGHIGTNTRVNLLAGGASILKNDGNSATAFGVGLATGGGSALGGVVATPSTAVFGSTSTSIIAPTTPSSGLASGQAPRYYGAYIQGGATFSATVSNTSAATGQITGTILWYPVSHPAIVRSGTE